MSRLVVFANRVPAAAPPSGGLVVALESVLKDYKGLWIGTHSDGNGTQALQAVDGPGFDCMTLGLSAAETAGYYLGHANSVLWPLLHGRADLSEPRGNDLQCYLSVNERLARAAAQFIGAGDTIWVHDYHLIPLAAQLRALGLCNPIGFFLHTPFPDTTAINALPDPAQFLSWFAHYDLVGLQTQRDVANFLSAYRQQGAAEIIRHGQMSWAGKMFSVGSFPIGIDAESFRRAAEEEAEKDERGRIPHRLMVGVDRLDYTKGISQRLRGFQTYLRQSRSEADRISFVQIAPPTREGLHAYQDTRRELEQLSGEVNGEFSDIGYVPVQYIHRAIPRRTIAGLLRRADIGLVTSLNDGMNLVAKEFIAAQPDEDPGVLILSRFAGAAEQMGAGALLVNPYDPESIAAAIHIAASMQLGERKARHQTLLSIVRAQDDQWWASTFLKSLALARQAQVTPYPETRKQAS